MRLEYVLRAARYTLWLIPLWGGLCAPAVAKSWQLTPKHASVGFTFRVFGAKLQGDFHDFSGQADYDQQHKDASQLNAQVAMASLDIKLPKILKWLVSDDMLKTKQHPYMVFSSKNVRFTSNNQAKIMGDLTFLGVTRPIIIDAQITPAVDHVTGSQVLRFHGMAHIKRRDFKFFLPVPGVSEDVNVMLQGDLVPYTKLKK